MILAQSRAEGAEVPRVSPSPGPGSGPNARANEKGAETNPDPVSHSDVGLAKRTGSVWPAFLVGILAFDLTKP